MDGPVQSQPDEGKRQTRTLLIDEVGAFAGVMDSIDSAGLHCTIAIPLTQRIARTPAVGA